VQATSAEAEVATAAAASQQPPATEHVQAQESDVSESAPASHQLHSSPQEATRLPTLSTPEPESGSAQGGEVHVQHESNSDKTPGTSDQAVPGLPDPSHDVEEPTSKQATKEQHVNYHHETATQRRADTATGEVEQLQHLTPEEASSQEQGLFEGLGLEEAAAVQPEGVQSQLGSETFSESFADGILDQEISSSAPQEVQLHQDLGSLVASGPQPSRLEQQHASGEVSGGSQAGSAQLGTHDSVANGLSQQHSETAPLQQAAAAAEAPAPAASGPKQDLEDLLDMDFASWADK
jgi:hypothetical protein